MKQEDKRYEEWLKDVRNRQPLMSNPEELTASILQRVALMPKRKQRRKLLIGRWLSGVAAGLLLCLLISEAILTTAADNVRVGELYLRQESSAFAIPAGWDKMNIAEKSEYLSQQYIQPRQMRNEKRRDLLKKTY